MLRDGGAWLPPSSRHSRGKDAAGMRHEYVRGIFKGRWDRAGVDTVSLASGALSQLERLKCRLRDAPREKLRAAIERQSRG